MLFFLSMCQSSKVEQNLGPQQIHQINNPPHQQSAKSTIRQINNPPHQQIHQINSTTTTTTTNTTTTAATTTTTTTTAAGARTRGAMVTLNSAPPYWTGTWTKRKACYRTSFDLEYSNVLYYCTVHSLGLKVKTGSKACFSFCPCASPVRWSRI